MSLHAKRYAENSWHEYKLQKHWRVADEFASEGMMEKTECGVRNADYGMRITEWWHKLEKVESV